MAADSSDKPDERPVRGLFSSISALAARLIGVVRTRLELLTTELQEQVHLIGAILLWASIAASSAMLAVFLAALTVIFAFWETHRIAASIGVIALFLAITVLAFVIVVRKLRRKSPLLGDTLAELAKDCDQLRARR